MKIRIIIGAALSLFVTCAISVSAQSSVPNHYVNTTNPNYSKQRTYELHQTGQLDAQAKGYQARARWERQKGDLSGAARNEAVAHRDDWHASSVRSHYGYSRGGYRNNGSARGIPSHYVSSHNSAYWKQRQYQLSQTSRLDKQAKGNQARARWEREHGNLKGAAANEAWAHRDDWHASSVRNHYGYKDGGYSNTGTTHN